VKVGIYARYSSDNQRDASIADQLRIGRAFAARQGWTIADEYSDHVNIVTLGTEIGFSDLSMPSQIFPCPSLLRRGDLALLLR
jgi:hypothetical protein